MKTLFHSSLYRFDQAQPSYWEDNSHLAQLDTNPLADDSSCDVAIIGGGYSGLSAALHLARDFQFDARVLEAGHIGWGASGRNGGFCSMGSNKLSLPTQIRRFGLEQTRYFHRSQADAVNLVRELGTSEAIDFLPQGDGEFAVAESRKQFDALCESADYQRRELGVDVHALSPSEFRERGYDAPHQHGALLIKPTFGLHPLRYCLGLAAAAQRHGAVLHSHSRAQSWRKEGRYHILQTAAGSLRAERVILTGNGFMPEYLHRGIAGRPLPVQSQIIVSRPMDVHELQQRGWFTENPTFNCRHLFFYYRILSDGRFLLGARGDATGDPAKAERGYDAMRRAVAARWPQFADLEYTHQWRGLVCFGLGMRPSIGRMPEDKSVYYAYGYHGTGVSTATWSGRALARWIAGSEGGDHFEALHLPAILRGRSPRFPLAFLRRQYLRVGLAFYRVCDWLGG